MSYEPPKTINYVHSVRSQAWKRTTIAGGMSAFFIYLGARWYDGGNVEGFWHVIAVFTLIGGLWQLIKEIIFAIRSVGATGQWEIVLNKDVFRWQAPKHAHGREVSFSFEISDIDYLETVHYDSTDDSRETAYFLHPKDHKPIRLHNYSGISCSGIIDVAENAGIDTKVTHHN